MAKYKRADLAEEEDSVHVNTDNNHLKTHVLPIQPPGVWKSRSPLEKILLAFSLLTFVTLCIFFACFVRGYRSWYILQVDPQSVQGNQDLIISYFNFPCGNPSYEMNSVVIRT